MYLPYRRIAKELVYQKVWEVHCGDNVSDTRDWFSAEFNLTRRPLVIAGRREKLIYSTLYLGRGV